MICEFGITEEEELAAGNQNSTSQAAHEKIYYDK